MVEMETLNQLDETLYQTFDFILGWIIAIGLVIFIVLVPLWKLKEWFKFKKWGRNKRKYEEENQ